MTERQMVKFTATSIVPPSLRQAWRNQQAVVSASGDQIVITKMRGRSITWPEFRKRMKAAGKELTPSDLEEAIRSVRASPLHASSRP